MRRTHLDERSLLVREHVSIPYRWLPCNEILEDIRLVQTISIVSPIFSDRRTIWLYVFQPLPLLPRLEPASLLDPRHNLSEVYVTVLIDRVLSSRQLFTLGDVPRLQALQIGLYISQLLLRLLHSLS